MHNPTFYKTFFCFKPNRKKLYKGYSYFIFFATIPIYLIGTIAYWLRTQYWNVLNEYP